MKSIKDRPTDMVIIAFFVLFLLISFTFEAIIVHGVDIRTSKNIFAKLWLFYAENFDPVFLDTPLWLKLMLAMDEFVYGPFYLVAIYAFIKNKNWIRIPVIIFSSFLFYSLVIYFGWEFLDEKNRSEANLPMVFLMNCPYLFFSLLLYWRMRHPEPFGKESQ